VPRYLRFFDGPAILKSPVALPESAKIPPGKFQQIDIGIFEMGSYI
jgi:hypothetical protein